MPGPDAISTLKNVATSGNVLANDKDTAGGTLSFVSYVPVAGSVGTLTFTGNGAYTFTPALNFTGTASTTYTVANANRTKTGNILITVRATNVARSRMRTRSPCSRAR